MNWNNGTTGGMPSSVEQLMKVWERFSEIPRPELDVILFTQEAFDSAKEHIEAREKYQSSPATFPGMTIGGLPFEIYPSKAELLLRGMKLREEGRRVAACF